MNEVEKAKVLEALQDVLYQAMGRGLSTADAIQYIDYLKHEVKNSHISIDESSKIKMSVNVTSKDGMGYIHPSIGDNNG